MVGRRSTPEENDIERSLANPEGDPRLEFAPLNQSGTRAVPPWNMASGMNMPDLPEETVAQLQEERLALGNQGTTFEAAVDAIDSGDAATQERMASCPTGLCQHKWEREQKALAQEQAESALNNAAGVIGGRGFAYPPTWEG
jgi:hypothetical protein